MSPSVANFLFEAVNFALLAGALGWLLFKPVRRVLDDEVHRHGEASESEKRLRAEAEKLMQEARARREQVDGETAQRRDELLASARREADRILEEARRTLAAERETLAQELATSSSAEAQALADELGRVTSGLVARMLDQLDGPSLDRALLAAACTRLRALAGAGRAAAVVESARPLAPEERHELEAVLTAGFEVRTVPELGAGVRVTTAAGQVDASATSIARQAARAVAEAAAQCAEASGG